MISVNYEPKGMTIKYELKRAEKERAGNIPRLQFCQHQLQVYRHLCLGEGLLQTHNSQCNHRHHDQRCQPQRSSLDGW